MSEEQKEEQLVYSYRNGAFNTLSNEKIDYIRKMRLDMCGEDMIHRNTGLLNLEYFAMKKGSYWAPHLTELLKEMLLLYGAYNSQYCVYSVIKRHRW
jgi:hypothetical protein